MLYNIYILVNQKMMTLDTIYDDNTIDDFPTVAFNKRPEIACACRVVITCEGTPDVSIKYPFNTEFIFTVGESDDQISDVLESLLLTMHCNDSRKVQIVTGEDGINSCIPIACNSEQEQPSHQEKCVTVDLTLIDICNKPPVCFWSLDEKYETALHHKIEGVRLFKEDHTDRAFRRFSLALKFLILMHPQTTLPPELKEKFVQLRTQCYSNLAACQLKHGSYQYVIENCNKVLDLEVGNTKCLFRRAEAYYALEKFDLCRSDVKKGLMLEPNSKSFITLLQKMTAETHSVEKPES